MDLSPLNIWCKYQSLSSTPELITIDDFIFVHARCSGCQCNVISNGK